LKRVYLDHAATTPLNPQALEAMLPWLDAGNPSTLYAEGRQARQAIDEARETLAKALHSEFAEVIFTSGGTESATLAIVGSALAGIKGKRMRVLISAAEHHCVLNTKPMLEAFGYEVETITVDRESRIELNSLAEMLDEEVLLVCAMHANNETGAISDVKAISELAHAKGALFFCDSVQTFLKMSPPDADLISVSGHKVGGPKGAGALYIRAGTRLKPILAGGGQERELRAGTENVAAIAGFGAAVKDFYQLPGLNNLRDEFNQALVKLGAVPTVHQRPVLDGHVHVRFPGVSAESLLIVLDRLGVSAGSGAACSSGSIEPSHVLLACGYSLAEAKEGIRFTLSGVTTREELEIATSRLEKALKQVRS
jgi:cysteine desulfurase